MLVDLANPKGRRLERMLVDLANPKGRRLERMLVDLANPTMNYPVHPLLTLQQTVSRRFMFSPLICCGNKSSPLLVILVFIKILTCCI